MSVDFQLTASQFWPQLGEFFLILALAASAFSIVISLVGAQKQRHDFVRAGYRAQFAAFFLVTLSVVSLWVCFLTDNFQLRYVYGYSNRDMPIIYKFTALWGGQDGSLLFWLWIATGFAGAALFFHRKTDKVLIPYMSAVFGVIAVFFSSIILFSDNPFDLFPLIPNDGRGLNPLLQNPSMAIHPPSLYLGYVGMSVPFAFAIAALMSGQLGIRWILASRIWTLLAWFFLSVGNLLGAQWAYVELGWGGFWAWDPVENAAILPWFTASAFLHSVMIQEKRGMLKLWNMNLIVLSFALTILGTYLTRSGVVQSVHSFASSDIGYWFLAFLFFIIIVSAILIYYRRHDLKSENVFESFLSKESAFVVNNIVLVGSAFVILWSTLFPTASELIIGTRIIVGPPFFNKILAPFALALLILTGIGPVIAWRKASDRHLKKNFTIPIILGVLGAIFTYAVGLTHWYVVATGFGIAFVISTIVGEFYRGGRARVISQKENWGEALLRATLRNHRKYGGHIVHLGLVCIFAGIAGAAYRETHEFTMKPGTEVALHEYRFVLENFRTVDNSNQREDYAVVNVFQNDRFVRQLSPAKFFYKAQQQPSTEVDIYSRVKEDVYLILGSYAPFIQEARIRVILQPGIFWLWFGGFVLILGGLLSMLPSMGLRLEAKQKLTDKIAA